MKRVAIYEGGGAKGALSAGETACKIDNFGYQWDEYYGTSAGALVAMLASTGDPMLIRKAFTTMSNKDVWKKNPLNKKAKINKANAIVRFLRGKESLGSTATLRKTMEKLYTEEMYNKVVSDGIVVVACSVDYTTGKIAYGRNDILPYREFMDIVWASTCVPILCPPVTYNGCKLQDGGLLMNTPIQQAIDNGADEIDVFMLNPKSKHDAEVETEVLGIDPLLKEWEGDNMIDIGTRSIELMMEHITATNLIVSKLKAKNKNVKIRFRYPEKPLVKKAIEVMNFDKKQMTEWFDLGWEMSLKEDLSIKVNIKKS